MQFNTTQTGTYNDQAYFYNQFSINDISNYIGSFSKNPIPENELNNVAANIIEIIGKDLTLDQQIEKEI